jgi:hypothetical protein
LLGSYAAAALCWQVAAHRGELAKPRLWPLVGLAASLALTLNVHFYGVLLPIAICGAEFVRTALRRRLDTAMLAAIGLGVSSLAVTLPYVKASSEFKKHYYAGPVSAHLLTQPYRQMLMDYTTYPKPIQTALVLLLLLAAAIVLWSCIRVARRNQIAASTAEWVLLILLALMPVFAFVLGKAVTHALEVRHSIGAIVAISSLFAVALSPALRQKPVFASVIAVMLATIVLVNAMRIRTSTAADRKTLADLTLSPYLTGAIAANSDPRIYFQDLGRWETASLYEPNPSLRSRLVLVYSRSEEMSHESHDTMYLTATHTQKFSPQPIVSYDDLRRTPGDHIFATYHTGWDWTDAAFATEAAQVQPLGQGFGGDVVKVRFK